MILNITDIINSILQAVVFVILPNYCVKDRYKSKKGRSILAVSSVWLGLQIVMKFMGNSSISIIMSHLVPFVIVLMFYRRDKISVTISYSILYLVGGLSALISSKLYWAYIQPMLPKEYIELGVVVFIYGINYILFLLILMNKKIFYKLYTTIKSRNISIIFLVLLTVFLDLLLSFDKIVNWSDDPIYRGYVFAIIVLTFAGATLYFASIEKRSREIKKLNDSLEERIKELNKIKHDYGAQISYLYGLHLMKRYERAGELLKDIINGHNSIDTAIEVSNNSDSVIAIITKGIRQTGIKVILDENADLNDIEMAEFELQKVLSNIISNAVTAMNGQGILAIRTFEKFNDIVICIQNNGPMIEDEVIDKIFQSGFSTKDNSNKEHGFGLAIVKETIEKCKGKISVTSDIEKTEFIITIPRKDK